jgi:hypothetical protein
MIPLALAQLSAENPVDENRVAKNDRQHHQRSDQHEDMGCRRRGRLPNRQRRRNDIGQIRDQKSEIAQQEKSDGCEERKATSGRRTIATAKIVEDVLGASTSLFRLKLAASESLLEAPEGLPSKLTAAMP